MEEVAVKKLHICGKCGNVMVNRVIKKDSDKLERILQCIVCRHWVPLN
jgi:predicted PP-loop superfamily ATPase